jgi:hypothetical protein
MHPRGIAKIHIAVLVGQSDAPVPGTKVPTNKPAIARHEELRLVNSL